MFVFDVFDMHNSNNIEVCLLISEDNSASYINWLSEKVTKNICAQYVLCNLNISLKVSFYF